MILPYFCSFAIVPRGECPYESSKSARLKFNGSSNHGGHLKLGANFIEQLNLYPVRLSFFRLYYLSVRLSSTAAYSSTLLHF